MTAPIVLRKQRSGKPSFWDVNDWEMYDQFVRHIRRERAKILMQQNFSFCWHARLTRN